MAQVKHEKPTEASFTQSPKGKDNSRESVLGEPEPWEPWETKLCLWSLGIGIVTLLILGFLINQFLL
jgi:hypothetical protein